MKICSISSGSSGNCIYVGSDDTHILIDVGLSKKRIEEGLRSIGVEPHLIQGIFITHEHSDHIKGLGVMSRKYRVPIYATKDTIHVMKKIKSLGKIEQELFKAIAPNEDLQLGDLTIHPFETSHDAIHPVCYSVCHNGKKISVATDLGNYNEYIMDKLKGSHVLFIEANHDLNMLDVGPYPYHLKQRIKSDLGHLSNDATSQLICDLYHDEMKYIILGHLSNENNYPEVAYETIRSQLLMEMAEVLESVEITVAVRDQVSAVFNI